MAKGTGARKINRAKKVNSVRKGGEGTLQERTIEPYYEHYQEKGKTINEGGRKMAQRKERQWRKSETRGGGGGGKLGKKRRAL